MGLDIRILDALIGFLVTIVVGSIVYWVKIKDRAIVEIGKRLESIYHSLDEKVDAIVKDVSGVILSFRLIEKDIETIKSERKNLEDMKFSVTKAVNDINNAHEKVRALEKEVLTLRTRTHWANNMFQKVNAKLVKLHGGDGEIDFGDMPKRE